MAASATDNRIGVQLIGRVVAHTPTVTKAWVDAGFKDDVAIHGAVRGIDVEQVLRSDSRAGFVPIAKRWIVEQVNGTLMLYCRLVREYEIREASSESHLVGGHREPGPPPVRHRHAVLAGHVNRAPFLEVITARESAATVAADELREQIHALSEQLTALETELADLATTRTTLLRLAGHPRRRPERRYPAGWPSYQQILAVVPAMYDRPFIEHLSQLFLLVGGELAVRTARPGRRQRRSPAGGPLPPPVVY